MKLNQASSSPESDASIDLGEQIFSFDARCQAKDEILNAKNFPGINETAGELLNYQVRSNLSVTLQQYIREAAEHQSIFKQTMNGNL